MKTPENTDENSDETEPVPEGYIQIQYSSD